MLDLTGEQPAAMQHGKNGGRGVVQSACSWWTTLFVTLLFMTATKWMSSSAMASQNLLPLLDDEAIRTGCCSALLAVAVNAGNLTPNCSTDWTVSTISRGGKADHVKPLYFSDVPSRCPMMMTTTHSTARSSWLPKREREKTRTFFPFCFFFSFLFSTAVGINEVTRVVRLCKYMNNVGIGKPIL